MAKPTCMYCGAKLSMKAAFVCEPCARERMPSKEELDNLLHPNR